MCRAHSTFHFFFVPRRGVEPRIALLKIPCAAILSHTFSRGSEAAAFGKKLESRQISTMPPPLTLWGAASRPVPRGLPLQRASPLHFTLSTVMKKPNAVSSLFLFRPADVSCAHVSRHPTFDIPHYSSCLVPVLPEQPHAFYVIADTHPHMRWELPRG